MPRVISVRLSLLVLAAEIGLFAVVVVSEGSRTHRVTESIR